MSLCDASSGEALKTDCLGGVAQLGKRTGMSVETHTNTSRSYETTSLTGEKVACDEPPCVNYDDKRCNAHGTKGHRTILK